MARTAALAGSLLALVLLPAGAQAGWGKPFRISQPYASDLTAPELSFAGNSRPAVGFGITDGDYGGSQGEVALPRHRGPRPVPGAALVLSLGYVGSTLEILTGHNTGHTTHGTSCCDSAQIVSAHSRLRYGPPRTLLSGLSGFTQGRLVPLGRGLLAAVATARGVWVAQSRSGGRFGRVHRLSGPGAVPRALQAAALPSGGAMVAYAAGHGSLPAQSVLVARGSRTSAPGRARVLVGAHGYSIDELSLGAGAGPTARGHRPGAGPVLAWVESWFDRRGNYRTQVAVAQSDRPGSVSSFGVPGEILSGVSVAESPGGRALVSFEACTREGDCAVHAAVRPSANARFGSAGSLGTIDAAEVPVAAMSSRGRGLVGWISNGSVLAAALGPGSPRPSRPTTVSSTRFGADVTLGFAPSGAAFAAWTQGTFAPDVIGSYYRP